MRHTVFHGIIGMAAGGTTLAIAAIFKPWEYRRELGYLLRAQDDYRDVFQLHKFLSGHADWKPFLAHTLGFNAENIELHYRKELALEEKQQVVQTIMKELGGSVEDGTAEVESIIGAPRLLVFRNLRILPRPVRGIVSSTPISRQRSSPRAGLSWTGVRSGCQ
jgi:hypothetical protein